MPPKNILSVPKTLGNRLLTYSAAASMALATGAGLAKNVQAEPTFEVNPDQLGYYDDFDIPLSRTLRVPLATGTVNIGATIVNGTQTIDFDGDGDPEFVFIHNTSPANAIYLSVDTAGSDIGLSVRGYTAGGVNYGTALAGGVPISAGNTDWIAIGTNTPAYLVYSSSSGPWGAGVTNGYLGLRFTLNGVTHYGWLRLTVPVGGGNVAIDRGAYSDNIAQTLNTGFSPTPVTLKSLSARSTNSETSLAQVSWAAAGLATLAGALTVFRRHIRRWLSPLLDK